MFSPFMLAVTSVMFWYAISHQPETVEGPKLDNATGQIDLNWQDFVLTSTLHCAWICVAALLLDGLRDLVLSEAAAGGLLFALGAVLSIAGAREAVTSAESFVEAERQAPENELDSLDYAPSWVLLPLMPAVLAIAA